MGEPVRQTLSQAVYATQNGSPEALVRTAGLLAAGIGGNEGITDRKSYVAQRWLSFVSAHFQPAYFQLEEPAHRCRCWVRTRARPIRWAFCQAGNPVVAACGVFS